MRQLSRFTMPRSGVIAATNNPDLLYGVSQPTSIGDPASDRKRLYLATWLVLLSTQAIAIEGDHVLNVLVPNPEYRAMVKATSYRFNVPAPLLAALIDQETNSTWSPSITNDNPNGTVDIGLAQANSQYLEYFAWKFGLLDPTDPTQSINFCAKYLRYLYDHTGSWLGALISYKCGLNGKQTIKLVNVALGIMDRAGVKE
jgi:soluble lytic murein transglycosylase-like protein